MKPWHVILTILLASAICFFSGYYVGSRPATGQGNYVSTITFRDTLRDTIPIPVYETLIKEIPEVFPIYVTLGGDTIREPVYVPVPITQKEYSSDNYRAWVSGYKPSLDSVWVYPETTIIKEKARRWGIGVMAGYGYGKNGLSPYVGIGGYYRIW